MPINEPVPGEFTSQIQEFVDWYEGPGIQHLAFITDDIVNTVEVLRSRGVDFLEIPDDYYEALRVRLKSCQ